MGSAFKRLTGHALVIVCIVMCRYVMMFLIKGTMKRAKSKAVLEEGDSRVINM